MCLQTGKNFFVSLSLLDIHFIQSLGQHSGDPGSSSQCLLPQCRKASIFLFSPYCRLLEPSSCLIIAPISLPFLDCRDLLHLISPFLYMAALITTISQWRSQFSLVIWPLWVPVTFYGLAVLIALLICSLFCCSDAPSYLKIIIRPFLSARI